MKCTLILLLVSGLVMTSANAEVYRWVDKDGKVHYGDTPPLDVQAEKSKLSENVVGADEGGFETKRAMQIAPVTLYASDNCKEVCEQARNFLKKRKVPFSERQIKTKEELDALLKLTGSQKAEDPTLIIGKQVLPGFEESSWSGALDVVGYPKAL